MIQDFDPCNLTLNDLLKLRVRAKTLDLTRRMATSLDSGWQSTPYRGQGMSFAEVRAYQPGDDIRHMDWRVTARTGKPHTKIYEEEKQHRIFIVVDQRPSMFFATQGCLKSILAARIAALLAWASRWQQLSLGAMILTAETIHYISLQKSERTLLQLFNHLANIDHAASFQKRASVQWPQIYDQLFRRIPRDCQILIISDFNDLTLADAARLSVWRSQHRLYMLSVFDPIEKEMLPPATYCFSNGRRVLDIRLDQMKTQKRYQQYLDDRSHIFQQLQQQARILQIPFSTAGDYWQVLSRYFSAQKIVDHQNV